MPSGVHLPGVMRKLIFRYCIDLNKTADEIFELLFFNDKTQITLERIKDIITFFTTGNDNEITSYLNVAHTRKGSAGRKSILTAEDVNHLSSIIRQRKYHRLKAILSAFSETWDKEVRSVPATSTIFRTLHRIRFSRKTLTREHIHKDVAAQSDFLDRISFACEW